jgi:xylulokinase
MWMGIDIGTGGSRALLVDRRGAVRAGFTAPHQDMRMPRPLWAEQDPDNWWDAAVEAIRGVLAKAGIEGAAVKGIGLSGQMHGLVILDQANRVIRPSLIWCDQRSQAQVDFINLTLGRANVVQWTANPVLTGFTLPKLLWVRDHEPENFARVRHLLLPKDYVRFRLTGDYATEVSDASGTSLFDVVNRRWSREMMEGLRLDPAILPRCHESSEVTGQVTRAVAEATGLAPGIPVVGGGGDQASSAVGNGIVEPGIVSCTLGTSGVVFAHMEKVAYDPAGRVHTFCHAVRDKWHVMGVTQGAGLSLQWFRNQLAPGAAYDALTEEAAQAPAGSQGLFWLPYLMGERTPHLDATARGGWIGLTNSHTRADLVRALIEGVSYSQRDCLDIIGRRCAEPFLAAEPGRYHEQARGHAGDPGRLRLRGGAARAGRHGRVRLRARSLPRGHPRGGFDKSAPRRSGLLRQGARGLQNALLRPQARVRRDRGALESLANPCRAVPCAAGRTSAAAPQRRLLAHAFLRVGLLAVPLKSGPGQGRNTEVLRPVTLREALFLQYRGHTLKEAAVADLHVDACRTSVRQHGVLSDASVIVAHRTQANCPTVGDLCTVHNGAVINPAVVAYNGLVGDLGQRPAGRFRRPAALDVDVVVDVRVTPDSHSSTDGHVATDQGVVAHRDVTGQNGTGIEVGVRTNVDGPLENDARMNEGRRVDGDTRLARRRMRSIGRGGSLREEGGGVHQPSKPQEQNGQQNRDLLHALFFRLQIRRQYTPGGRREAARPAAVYNRNRSSRPESPEENSK